MSVGDREHTSLDDLTVVPKGSTAVRRRFLAILVAALLVMTACSGDDTGGSDTVPPTSMATPSSTTTSSVPETSTTTSTTTATTTTASAVSDDDVLAGWQAYWDVWAVQRASDPIDRERLEAVASPQVTDAAILFFEKEREGGFEPVSIPRIYPSGTVTELGDGTAKLTACTLITRSTSGIPGTAYEATMRETDEGVWIVDELAVISAGGCVPVELADAAIAAYEAYWDDRAELSNPADPEAAWLEERTTGQHYEVMTELYADFQERGLYFIGRPETHPEVVEVQRDWSLVVLDCMMMPEDWGVYELATGERTDDAETVGPDGRIDLRSASMESDELDLSGVWRVATLAGEVSASCEFAPTANALPQF